ncbi:MAG: RidA family protein [Rhodococcus sp.]|nr:RidA family protein [Rhodococcus sp. (in: high G+C Gram-positive bacteria)]
MGDQEDGDTKITLKRQQQVFEFREFNKVYLEYFPASRLPARSAFGTDGLALGAHMEVECMAYTPRV